MKGVLLGAALLWPVSFLGGPTVTLSLSQPRVTDAATVSDPVTLFNPQRSAAVVRQCVSTGVNADWCDLTLVLPRTGARSLPQGHLRGLPGVIWSPDGQAVLAFGDTWLRRWTLTGDVQGLSFGDQRLTGGEVLHRTLERVTFQGQQLCLTLRLSRGTPVSASVTPVPSSTAWTEWVVRRAYHWPSLRTGSPADDRTCRAP